MSYYWPQSAMPPPGYYTVPSYVQSYNYYPPPPVPTCSVHYYPLPSVLSYPANYYPPPSAPIYPVNYYPPQFSPTYPVNYQAQNVPTQPVTHQAQNVPTQPVTHQAQNVPTKPVTHQAQNVPTRKRKNLSENDVWDCFCGLDEELEEEKRNRYKRRRKYRKISDSLKEIIVDGCNVAMKYTKGQNFSETGIVMVVNYFRKRGHKVTVFLPEHLKSSKYKNLEKMCSEEVVVYTPSRLVGDSRITPYEDNYILEYATKCDDIVVFSDLYRDLYKTKPRFRKTIKENLLSPTFVGDMVMFPVDPLGRYGPTLKQFLRFMLLLEKKD